MKLNRMAKYTTRQVGTDKSERGLSSAKLDKAFERPPVQAPATPAPQAPTQTSGE